jgi:hypothetical protein
MKVLILPYVMHLVHPAHDYEQSCRFIEYQKSLIGNWYKVIGTSIHPKSAWITIVTPHSTEFPLTSITNKMFITKEDFIKKLIS